MEQPEQTGAGGVAVIGAGPAGLIAAEWLARAGQQVAVFDHMPSPARKLLIAGRGGLNLTHSEALDLLVTRYGAAQPKLEPAIRAFPPAALIAWCEDLGQPTFVGSSGRVFPKALKASPLLRAWLGRLNALGVVFRLRHRWTGWASDGSLCFVTPDGVASFRPDASILALGGASWPRLGSDGEWTSLMQDFDLAPLRPSNMGFSADWSERFRGRFEGTPLKRIALHFRGQNVRGEALVTADGIEGGAVYALSGPLRDAIAAEGGAILHIDLRPDLDRHELAQRLARRGSESMSNHLRKAVGLSPAAIGLVQEALRAGARPEDLPALVKALPVRLTNVQPIGRAISSAGGLRLAELDEAFMVRRRPGLFACGEMLDWEAPTGGYLLQACFATGVAAARGVLSWLERGR